MRFGLIAAAIVFVSFLSPAASSAQNAANLPADFIKARNERIASIATGNRSEWERLTTEGFIVITPVGAVEGKDRSVRMVPRTPTAAQNEGNQMATGRRNERIHIYNGNTVVVQWQQPDGDGRLTNFMETWVKEGNQWKAASAQASNIQAPPR